MIFIDLINEIKRRALRNQSGTEFDDSVKNVINTSLFRISREAPWRVMRRTTHFDTVTSYTSSTGYASVTQSSTTWSVSGANLFTDKIEIGRLVDFDTGGVYTIRSIFGDSSSNLDRTFEGTTSTATSYKIYPQEEYIIPMQAGHRMFMWHEKYGYPFLMTYVTDQTFFGSGAYRTTEAIPTHYRMWGEDNAITKLPSTTHISIQSSSVADTSTSLTIFGKIGGYPAFESVSTDTTSGTSLTSTTNAFDTFERVAISSPTNGYVTLKSVDGDYTVSVIPQGEVGSVMRKRIQISPLSTSVFPINISYYKDPFPLKDDGDIHELGQEFDEAIILLSVSKIKYQDDQKEGDRFVKLYADELKSLRRTNIDKIDFFPRLQKAWGRGEAAVHSQLLYRQAGPYYGTSSRI